VALVTGAGRGIGAATVARLAAEGWAVVAVDIADDIPELPYAMATAAELDAVAAAGGDNVIAVRADVRDLTALCDAVAVAEERWGGLDAAVSCAGVMAGGEPHWQVAPAAEQVVIEVNLTGTLNLARAAVPALLRRPEPRQGRFIAIASTAATHGLELLSAYCASKAGVTGLVRALAAELRSSGVTANAISPGSTATKILEETRRLYNLTSVEDFSVHQVVGRLLQPSEIAAAVAFLAGPEGSAITGVDMPVSGGFA
jgi:SDR family mycofactocin-dependent oxidoreductase